MARRRQAKADPSSRAELNLFVPAESAQPPGENPGQADYQDLWTTHEQVGWKTGSCGDGCNSSGIGCPLPRSLGSRSERHYARVVADSLARHETQPPLRPRGRDGRVPETTPRAQPRAAPAGLR